MSYLPEKPIKVSTLNSTTTALSGSEVFTGTWEDVTDTSLISVALGTGAPAASGSLYLEFSQDGSTLDRQILIPVSSIATPKPGIHTLIPISQYFRMRYENSTTAQTTFRVQTLLHRFTSKIPTSRLAQAPSAYNDVEDVRSHLYGVDSNTNPRAINATPLGHLEVAIHDPVTAFGEVAVQESTPLVGMAFPFDEHSTTFGRTLITGSGNVTFGDGIMSLSSGNELGGAAVYASRRLLTYFPGNGIITRFTALFSSGAVGQFITAGAGHSEEGFFFGRANADNFGILHVKNGRRQIQALTMSVGSSAATNATVTLNGQSVSVPISNNAGSTTRTAWDVANNYNYVTVGGGFDAYATGSVVIFSAIHASPLTGTMSFVHATASGSFSTLVAGVTSSITFVSQSQWNEDTLDGSGGSDNPSGLILDTQKLNVYAISYQYLGGGAITFSVEEPSSSDGVGEILPVHRIFYAGSSTVPSLQRASLPITFSAVSRTGTTDVSIKSSSMFGATQGKVAYLGPKRAISVSKTSIGTSFTPLLTLFNPRVRISTIDSSKSRVAFILALLKRLSVANVGTKGAEIRVYRSSTLNNTALMTPISDSKLFYDTSATSFTDGVLILASTVAAGTNVIEKFDTLDDNIVLAAGDSLTIVGAANSTTTDFSLSLSWIEQGV